MIIINCSFKAKYHLQRSQGAQTYTNIKKNETKETKKERKKETNKQRKKERKKERKK